MITEQDWRQMGNCLGVDAEVFFPHRGEDTRIAKEIRQSRRRVAA